MKIYHYTNVESIEGIISTGRILPWHRAFYPPTRRYRRALWAMAEPLPEAWLKYRPNGADLVTLFNHTSRDKKAALLEIELNSKNEVWAADWENNLKDHKANKKRREGHYSRLMRPYRDITDLNGMAAPEIICFGPVAARQCRQVPLPKCWNMADLVRLCRM